MSSNLKDVWSLPVCPQHCPSPLLTQVATEFRLGSDTLSLAIAYMDRYLHLQDITEYQLQLLGTASLWVAAKYEEIMAPAAADVSRAGPHHRGPTAAQDV
jgi:hypothetical protein